MSTKRLNNVADYLSVLACVAVVFMGVSVAMAEDSNSKLRVGQVVDFNLVCKSSVPVVEVMQNYEGMNFETANARYDLAMKNNECSIIPMTSLVFDKYISTHYLPSGAEVEVWRVVPESGGKSVYGAFDVRIEVRDAKGRI